ncbi:MAG: hypothetical protein ABF913_03725 [Oenococcus sp.]|uniref:hypothetical protein n=1 Tax=Oenococcus sp. TaxID=1979414 RepID=UPI0039ED1641
MAKVTDGDFKDLDDDFDDFGSEADDLGDRISEKIDRKFKNWAKDHPQQIVVENGHHRHGHHGYVINNGADFYSLGLMLSAGITWFVSHHDVWTTIWHGLLSWLYFGYWLAQTLH